MSNPTVTHQCTASGCKSTATHGYVIENRGTGVWMHDETRFLCELHATATRQLAEAQERYLVGRLHWLRQIPAKVIALNAANEQFEVDAKAVLTGETMTCPHVDHHHFGRIIWDKKAKAWIISPNWRICGKCRKAAFRVQKASKFTIRITGTITHVDQIDEDLAKMQEAMRAVQGTLGNVKQHLLEKGEDDMPIEFTESDRSAEAAKSALLLGHQHPLEPGLPTVDETLTAEQLEAQSNGLTVTGDGAQSIDEAVDTTLPAKKASPKGRRKKKTAV